MTVPAKSPAKLLVVHDEAAQFTALCTALEREGYAITCSGSADAALALLREQTFDLVLADLGMGALDGGAFLHATRDIDPDVVGILMTGLGTIEAAVQAVEAGALDYITKPFKANAVLPVLARALEVRQLRLENIHLQQAVAVYDLSMGIRLTLGSDVVLQKIADAAMGHTQVHDISVLLPVEDGKALHVAVARGENAAQNEGKRLPFNRVISQWVERSLERCARPSEISEIQAALPLTLSGMPGGVSLPMLAGGTFIGIIHFTSKHPGRAVSSEQTKALNILAAAGAAALAAAGLLEQLRSAERSYRSLAESAADIIFRYELQPQPRFGQSRGYVDSRLLAGGALRRPGFDAQDSSSRRPSRNGSCAQRKHFEREHVYLTLHTPERE